MEDVPATSVPAGTISAIDRTTVHQICSGQVVLNLATAVKELVENSLDAGATQIEVKLKDHGSSQIEVADNGNGVQEENFQGLTLKHHTSKLREFEDLISVETFGFRGEALSSLCALSDITISTRHKDASSGSLITYDHNGKLVSVEKLARAVGTTVTLGNIFSTMPVRQKEFQRNIKKEFSRLCHVLNAYCLVSVGVRIQCTNTVGKGRRSTVMATTGEGGVRENIVSLFGAKQMSLLRPLENCSLTQEEWDEIKIQKECVSGVALSGYVSSCVHGEGRGAADRQFYFINNRPCDPAKISKIVNEVYHSYNRNQFPFVYVNVTAARTSVDVNITPDKRQVFLQNEKYLCSLVKKSLASLYENTPSSIPLGKDIITTESIHRTNESPREGKKISLDGLKRKFAATTSDNLPTTAAQAVKKQRTVDHFFTRKSRQDPLHSDSSAGQEVERKEADLDNHEIMSESDVNSVESVTFRESDNIDNKKKLSNVFDKNNAKQEPSPSSPKGPAVSHNRLVIFDDFATMSAAGDYAPKDCVASGHETPTAEKKPLVIFDDFATISKSGEMCSRSQSDYARSDKENSKKQANGITVIMDDFSQLSSQSGVKLEFFNNGTKSLEKEEEVEEEFQGTKDLRITEDPVRSDYSPLKNLPSHPVERKSTKSTANPQLKVTLVEEAGQRPGTRRTATAGFNWDKLKSSLNTTGMSGSQGCGSLKFKARINPEDNTSAEAELQRQICKADFANMEIFGQFNLGFIIAGLQQDIFIIDQHATDEKYNFETLQKTTSIGSQKMVSPLGLELTAVNENILVENVGVFEKNGFSFLIDPSAPPTKRVKLTHLPISKNWTFGAEDIDELIFLLAESPEGTICRPSRVRAMFASRACRTSVMIGKALSKADMRKLVDHMGQIEQPWNCPHGRPTIRHLVSLGLFSN